MSQETEWFEAHSTESKIERATLRDIVLRVYGWIGAACLVFLLMLAATWPTQANAAPVFKHIGNDGNPASLRLLDKPCTDEKVLAHLKANVKAEYIAQFRAAVLNYGLKDWASCWIEYDGHILSFDEEGAPFNPPNGIPRSMFREDAV